VSRFFSIIVCIFISSALLAACSGSSNAAPAVESYLKALVAKDADRLSALSCADWESKATDELNSFEGVSAKLSDLACQQTGTEGEQALVKCTGKIIATYGNEDQEIDLSVRTYVLVKQSGEWLVCGVK
jgi:hypothetical protein